MITIRDPQRHPIQRGPAQRLITLRSTTTRVARVEVRADGQGPALLYVAWADGSTAICDWASAEVCLAWVKEQPWARGVLKVTYPRVAA